MALEKKRAKKSENFSEWYTSTLIDAGMLDYSSVSGMIVFMPDCYFVWEAIQRATDELFKEDGIQNAYFPLFIPERLLNKEKEHVEGFLPEVAWVTHAGETKLDERLAVRPTSEAIMYESFAKWIRSWRDLPLRLNQWNSVVRWEFKHPMLLIRNREFLWNEGHSVFANREEAMAERDRILGIYQIVIRDYLALSGIVGRKSDKEKFSGAEATFSIEFIMPDGWAIQGPDWHFDGQNFAKAYGIQFLDSNSKKDYAWQNTYAISTRMLGIMAAVHGDDKGLILPPRLARIQVAVVPIYNDENKDRIITKAKELHHDIDKRFRVYLDDRDYSPGWKFNEWELKGVPIRVEIGEKELESSKVTLFRRDTLERVAVGMEEVQQRIEVLLIEIHQNMLKRAKQLLDSSISNVADYQEMKDALKSKGGIMHAPWCGSRECEDKIKDETGAKITNMPLDQSDIKGKCIYCGKKATHMANFARSY